MDRLGNDRLSASPLGIGDALRHAREQRGLTLGQAAEATRIRSSHLIALEEEDLADLPAPVFARGLLRAYSRYLGLDSEDLIGRLDSHQLLLPTVRIQSEAPRVRSNGLVGPRLLAIVLAVGLLGGLGYYLYSQYRVFMATERIVPPPATALPTVVASAHTPAPAASPTLASTQPTPAQPAAAQPTPTRTPLPTPTATPLPTPTPTPIQTVTIEARFSGRCWAQVWVDDVEVVHSRTYQAGDRDVWTGKKVFLWVGNAGAVDIIYNGKPQGLLGGPGEAVKTTWSAH